MRQPAAQAWTDGRPLRLVEQAVVRSAPDPKALAADGWLVHGAGSAPPEVWLRFVTGRPVRARTTTFLGWRCDGLAARGQPVLVLVWDNASRQLSQEVRRWLREHTQSVKREGKGVRLLSRFLRVKRPWLNPIAPRWAHGKRHMREPTRLLSADARERRVCAAFHAPRYDQLTITKELA